MTIRRKESRIDPQLTALLSRTDWNDILELLRKKSFQRKFQIIEAFTEIVAEKGFSGTTHSEIARRCRITRQLVDHHFPDDSSLISLAYRYIYAGFQKTAADAIMLRSGLINQLRAYIDAISGWIESKNAHARFLAQFYGLLPTNAEFAEVQDRNLAIGRERITALLINAREEGLFSELLDEQLRAYASTVQTYILGYLVMHSWKRSGMIPEEAKQGLWRSCQVLLGLSQPPRKRDRT